MKKIKKEGAFNKILRKYKFTYLLGFVFLFLCLSAILGVSAYVAISRSYLSSAKTTIRNYIISVTNSASSPDGPVILTAWPNDQRMVVQYFYYDSSTNELRSVIVGIDDKYDDDIREAYSYAYSKRDFNEDLEEFRISDINGYTTLSYTEKVDLDSNVSISIGTNIERVAYIKVYMNVEGEESTRTQFIRIYLICAGIMLSLSIAAGLLMAKQGIKPLKVFVQKQIDFVNDASHELRTPLAVVQSKIENILANPDQTVYEASEALAISLNEINRLNKLTSELLTLARNDKDNMKLDMKIVDVDEELRNIIDPFVEIATIQNRKLHYIGCPNTYANLDVDKLKQIIIINIDNALKYTEDGDDITIVLSQTNNEAIIEVMDNGIGISEHTKKHIFERFYREDKARSRETGGNGLGLSIAYTLVNLQKGKIIVDHNYPKGTKFTIIFPRVKVIKKEENSKNEETSNNKNDKNDGCN